MSTEQIDTTMSTPEITELLSVVPYQEQGTGNVYPISDLEVVPATVVEPSIITKKRHNVSPLRRAGAVLAIAGMAVLGVAEGAAADDDPTVPVDPAATAAAAPVVETGPCVGKQPNVLNIAHRSIGMVKWNYAGRNYVEDTSRAALLGLHLKADGTEWDVQETKDHKLVVQHDDTTGRMMSANLKIKNSTLAQLRKLRYPDGTGIQTSTEFLKEVAPVLNKDCKEGMLELKSKLSKQAMKGLVKDINNIIKDPTLLTVSSNSIGALNQFNQADGDLHDTAKIMTGVKDWMDPAKLDKMGKGKIDWENIDWHAAKADAIAKASEYGVHVSTRNGNEHVRQKMIQIGAKRIIFNYTDLSPAERHALGLNKYSAISNL